MNNVVSKNKLSGSTNGRGIKVAATATLGTTIHTGPDSDVSADLYHEVWLYAVNSDTTGRELTIEWGGASSPDDQIKVTIPPKRGMILVVPGLLIQAASTPLVITAFCASANVVMIHGYYHAIQ